MTVKIDEDNLAKGVVGLVVALAEIIRDALRLQAIRRIESGKLAEEEIERLGNALSDLDKALENMKKEYGVAETVQEIRGSLDNAVSDVLDKFVNPKTWAEIKKERRTNLVAVKHG